MHNTKIQSSAYQSQQYWKCHQKSPPHNRIHRIQLFPSQRQPSCQSTQRAKNNKPLYTGWPLYSHQIPRLFQITDATVTVAHGGQTGLEVIILFFIKKLIQAPNLPASGDKVCS